VDNPIVVFLVFAIGLAVLLAQLKLFGIDKSLKRDPHRSTNRRPRFALDVVRWAALKEAEIWRWCREQDLNLHAFWALDPKSSASANSAIPAICLILAQA
jgi:hypothetical protein